MGKLIKKILIGIGVLFALIMAIGIWAVATETPEETAAREERMALEKAEKEAEKAAKEAAKAKAEEDKRQAEEQELAKKEAEEKAKAEAEAKAEEEKRLAEEKEAAEKAREAELNKYFSAWDGSNRELVNYVKANMNDPDSFDHVETLFKDHGDGYRIVMTFRGKNAFNATVTHKVMARLNKETRELTEIEMVQ